MASVECAPSAVLNRLVHESSPYLRQHAGNPVDWYPWGEEALTKARIENKPIFLSIGYSACHWCHVMARESFADAGIAAFLNEHFVSIKVDREERPDIDAIYMTAVVAMTGNGGWPMSVFLTPDLKPFYGGTYYPPVDLPGRPGFGAILRGVAAAWKDRREEVVRSAHRLTQHVAEEMTRHPGTDGPVTADLIAGAVRDLKAAFDREHGGWGTAPKFPSSGAIAVLLRAYRRSGDELLLKMAAKTLDRMAEGGMYDHLGGGFHRYAVDAAWRVPHFEKMLYDNAQLAQAYLEAYQLTGAPRYRRVAQETLDYVLRDMQDPAGGFHSAEDADSEGEEGRFYLWTEQEILEALGAEEGRRFCAYYGVRPEGNLSSRETYHRGRNVLWVAGGKREEMGPIGKKERSAAGGSAAREQLTGARERLLAVRNRRARPGRDDSVVTSWNALMVSALAQAAQVFDIPRYLQAAERAGRFLFETMMPDGELRRTYGAGQSRGRGYLDDYAFTANAFVDLYEATFEVRWLALADRLVQGMIARFWDANSGTFYFTDKGHDDLLMRIKPTYDGAEPSGNSVAALALLRLGALTGKTEYRETARQVLNAHAAQIARTPQAYLKMLVAVDFLVYAPQCIVIAGAREAEDTRVLLGLVRGHFVPNKVVALAKAGETPDIDTIPHLAEKRMRDGQATAYVCREFSCGPPTTAPKDLLEQLGLAHAARHTG